jgi:putative GTP pyrophosphokinase
MPYSDEEKSRLEASYAALLPRLKEAERLLTDLIQRVMVKIPDKRLVRATVRTKRVKSVDSLRRKAEAEGVAPKDACLSIGDVVGIRVVCSTVDDVYRFRELLREDLPHNVHVVEQDYIAEPKAGYRALHINFPIELGSPFSGDYVAVPCECQIRTLLQDSWAELVHADFYKEGDGLPDDLRERTHDLAETLSGADRTASRIRARVTQEARSSASEPPNAITKDSLAWAFGEVFGRWPPEYAVQRAYEACKETGLVATADFRSKLATKEFRDALDHAYIEELRFGPSLSAEEIFALAPIAVAKGDDAAIEKVRERAAVEREEIEAAWRSEVLSGPA